MDDKTTKPQRSDANIEERGIGADALQVGAGLMNVGAGAINLAAALRKPGSGDSGQGDAPPPKIELPPGVDRD